MVKRSNYKGVVRLRWREPRRFSIERWRVTLATQGLQVIRGVAIGVVLGLVVIAGVWFMQPFARPYLPRVLLGPVVWVVAYPCLMMLQVAMVIGLGRHADLRRGRLLIYEGQSGAYFSAEGVERVVIEVAGDVPLRLIVQGRIGSARRLSRRSSVWKVGVDPALTTAELSRATLECLGRTVEVVEATQSSEPLTQSP